MVKIYQRLRLGYAPTTKLEHLLTQIANHLEAPFQIFIDVFVSGRIHRKETFSSSIAAFIFAK